jgi:hypothetical protein
MAVCAFAGVCAVLALVASGASAVPPGAGGASAAASDGPPTLYAGGASTSPASPKRLTTAAVIVALAREGVGVYASPASTRPLRRVARPLTPIRVLLSQAKAYAAQTVQNSGTTGAQLNSLVRMPAAPAGKAYVPFAYLLAAYASGHSTAGEILAGKVLGSANLAAPDTAVFPDLVLTLLSADAYRAARAHARAGAIARDPSAHASDLSSACATLSSWVNAGFSALFDALTPGSSATSFLSSLWSSAVSLAQSAISGLVTILTAPILRAIRVGIATIGVVSWAISAVQNLKVSVVATPAPNKFGVAPAAGNAGSLTATLGDASGFDFPTGFTSCAQALGITLPSLNSVAGRTVTWTVTQLYGVPTSSWCSSDCDLATETSADTAFAADHTATLHYVTNVESADQAAGGALITSDDLVVSGKVDLDTGPLQHLLTDIVLGSVPGVVRSIIDSLTDSVMAKITSLVSLTFIHKVEIDHHGTPCLVGSWTETDQVSDGSAIGGAGTLITFDADGTYTVVYDAISLFNGSITLNGSVNGQYTLQGGGPTGMSGFLNENPVSGTITATSSNPTTPGLPSAPQVVPNAPFGHAAWTCSADTATYTLTSTADGGSATETWNLVRNS